MDYNRKYKCKYCDYRGNREQLVNHTEKDHAAFVTEEYPAARIVYNHLNNIETGHCIICNRPTKWNDKTWKYHRHCGSDKCKEAIKMTYRRNAIAAKGKYTFTDDPKHLEKMLANRKISGIYTCRDGSKKTYTGSYERKAIEFMDKVLECDPEDIMMPGPIFEYEYKGEKHKWITDIYYIPYNLVIEVKDGGDNPNKRSMIEYREKQVAKETAIINNGGYNYLRLTNNNFEQLMQMFTALRLAMMNDEDTARKAIIKINESIEDISSEMICTTEPDYALLFVYDDEISERVSYIGLTHLASNYCVIPTMEGPLVSIDKDDLPNHTESFNIVTPKEGSIEKIVEMFKYQKEVDSYTIYETITGVPFIQGSDAVLLEMQGILESNIIENDTLSSYVKNAMDYSQQPHCDSTYISDLSEATIALLSTNAITLQENLNGYYLESTSVYPTLATAVNDKDTTISLLDNFIKVVSRYGGNMHV